MNDGIEKRIEKTRALLNNLLNARRFDTPQEEYETMRQISDETDALRRELQSEWTNAGLTMGISAREAQPLKHDKVGAEKTWERIKAAEQRGAEKALGEKQ